MYNPGEGLEHYDESSWSDMDSGSWPNPDTTPLLADYDEEIPADGYAASDLIPETFSAIITERPLAPYQPADRNPDRDTAWQPPDHWDVPEGAWEYTNPAKGVPFVKDISRVQDILADPNRGEAPLYYWHSTELIRTKLEDADFASTPDDAELVVTTEREALQELQGFLTHFIEEFSGSTDGDEQYLVRSAVKLIENQHYMDRTAFDEATTGLAGLWKIHLDEHARNQIFVPQRVINCGTKRHAKSSERVFRAVLGHLDEARQQQVVTEPYRVRGNGRTKTVLLDDWMMSGLQMQSGYHDTRDMRGGLLRRHDLTDDIEVHVLAASDAQLADPQIGPKPVATYAYYRTPANGAKKGAVSGAWDGPLITGSHSSVDIGFEDIINLMVETLQKHSPDQTFYLPPPTNIARGRDR